MATWVYPGATLARIVDGDTFYADVRREFDFGFHVTVTGSARQRFRLNRCNAAPADTPPGAAGAARLTELLSAGPFTLTSVGPYVYRDEWMAEVVLADERNVTSVLITEGLAAPWNGRGPAPLPPWPRPGT